MGMHIEWEARLAREFAAIRLRRSGEKIFQLRMRTKEKFAHKGATVMGANAQLV
jgi:hypothetical protein